jgi:hypothetical protein
VRLRFTERSCLVEILIDNPSLALLGLAYLAGILVALAGWARHPRASLLAIVGFTGLLLLLVMPAIFRFLDLPLLHRSFYRISLALEAIAVAALIAGFALDRRATSSESLAGRRSIADEPRLTGAAQQQQQIPVVKPISKGLCLGSIVFGFGLSALLVGFLLVVFLQGKGRDREIVPLLMFPALLPALVSMIVVCVLIHRMWSSIQHRAVRTSPAAAVGLLFVPLFNLYWVFQAYWGWTKDSNRFAESRKLPVAPMPESLALVVCVLSLCAAIPVFGIFIAFVNCLLMLLFLNSAIDGVNALARVRAA